MRASTITAEIEVPQVGTEDAAAGAAGAK